MTMHYISRPIPLRRSLATRLIDAALECVTELGRRLASRWAAHAEWRRTAQADRALAELSLHTLCDIGAGPARTERRRELERQEADRLSRILASRGW